MLKQINKEIEEFKTKNIQVVPGLWFNQYENLQDIYFYYNSKFRSGELDEDGDRKYFYNITKNPCKVFSKAIDFDTKNIRLLTVGGGDPNKTWFMERDLKFWMRDKEFGKVLNRIFKELPIYGSVVLKIIEGTPYFVDLRNFVVEQSADSLDDSNFITEIHNFTVANFRKVAKQMKWDKTKVDDTIKKFYEMKDTSHIRVYERYGDICDENNNWSYRRVFYADVGVDEFDMYGNMTASKAGVELSSEEWEGHPYWEFHAEKISGRWQGVGVVETLKEPQIAENQRTNLQNKAASHLALLVFQTRDQAFNRNLLTDTKNGEVLSVDSELTQVNISDRNLAFFNEQHNLWLQNRDELTFSYDVVQGERLPAGTPLGSAQIAQAQTLSYFEQIQENVALDVKEMLYEIIIPRFQKENTQEHTLRLVGQDLDQYIEMVKNDLVLKEVVRIITNDGPFPTNEDKDKIAIAIQESIKQGKEKIITIPANFYDNVKYDVDIDITGESVDTRVRAATKFAVAQMITADPTMTTDPFKKKLLMSYMEDGGINPADFFAVETKQVDELPGRAGGGVSAPQLNATLAGQSQVTV